jgi:hypothetical protein
MMKVASTLTLLAGLWYFISPWVYGTYHLRNAWNDWIAGAVVVILAGIRLSSPLRTVALSWINCAFGVWAFVSPWIYGYTMDHGRFINSLCVGVILFVAAIWSATSTPHTHHPVSTHT